MPSHRADDPPLRRPRTGRSAPAVAAVAAVAAPPKPGESRTGSGARRRASRGRASHPSLTSLSAPQVGIAGVLGIATIAAPISGAMASPAPKTQVNTIQASPALVSAAFPALPGAGGTVVSAANVMPSTVLPSTQTPSLIAAPRTVLVTRASRAGERSVLPGCDGIPTITNAPNGELPVNSLCTLWDPKHRLRADAAVALAKLNVAYKQHFGSNICLTDSYRTLSEQYRLAWQRSRAPAITAGPWRPTWAAVWRRTAALAGSGCARMRRHTAGRIRTGLCQVAPVRTSLGTGSTSPARTACRTTDKALPRPRARHGVPPLAGAKWVSWPREVREADGAQPDRGLPGRLRSARPRPRRAHARPSHACGTAR